VTALESGAADLADPESLLRLAKDVLVARMGFEETGIDGRVAMADLGIDSVYLLELKVVLQQRLHVRIPLELLSLDDSLERFLGKVACITQ
jgi:acyl carrier protein